MTDRLEKIGSGSLISHGRLNDRIYLVKLDPNQSSLVIERIAQLAQENSYSKIVCKIPQRALPLFLAAGYLIEGYVVGFYKQREDAIFVSRFLSDRRSINTQTEDMQSLAELLSRPSRTTSAEIGASRYTIRKLGTADIEAMAEIYSAVFASYPSPIHDPAYLRLTMEDNVQYFGVLVGSKLVALASSEVDREAQSAEMTDFATDKHHTGNNLSRMLLQEMEQQMKLQGIHTLYSIARVASVPMNKTFMRLGYRYSGTLVNNTQIAGRIESMNLYYKQI